MSEAKVQDCRNKEYADLRLENSACDDALPEEADFQRKGRSIVRKLDLTLLPMVWVLYMFNYLDRNNISQAKLNTFTQDLSLKGDDFNTAVSILNVGYIIMQLPSNMIITRVRPSWYIPVFVCVWSCSSAATAASRSYQDLIIIRFFTGFVEAPFFPGVFYLLSCWYTKRELAFRTAVLYTGLILATAFSSLIAAGTFSGLSGIHGLAGWRWLFIIDGAASFGCGLLAFFVLPDFPESRTGSARWLFSEADLAIARERIKRDRVTDVPAGNCSVWHGLRLACMDRRLWVFVLMLIANHAAYGFNYFFPTIVSGFQLGSTTITLVLTTPPYLFATVVALFVAWSSDRIGERSLHIAVPMGAAAVGFIISAATTNTSARYVASFFYVSGCFSANPGVYSWVSSTMNQTPEKKAAAVAIINLSSQLGNIMSPYFFRPEDSPRYLLAMLLMLVFSLTSIATCFVMKWDLKKANQRLKEQEQSGRDLVLFTE